MDKLRLRRKQNKRQNRWFGAALLACILTLVFPFASRAAQNDTPIEYLEDLYITGFFEDAPDRQLHWTDAGSDSARQPYLFLPAGIDSDTVQIWFASELKSAQDGYATVNGVKVHSGDTIRLPEDGGRLTVTTGSGKTVTVGVKRSEETASLFLDTESGSMNKIHADKSNKEKGEMLLMRGDGSLDYRGALKHIKGRGNATWDMPKKPYNIKLEKSADLLGMGSAKGWCLLANYADTSLLRNHLVYRLAEETGIPFTMDSKSVDLYLNGKYNGTYLMTEKIEIGTNRVDITDMEKATEQVNPNDLDSYPAGGTAEYRRGTRKWTEIPNDPADITGGYLIEVELNERYAGEACGFVTEIGQAVTMKAPEFVSKKQIHYIADLYQEMEDAIYSKTGYNKQGRHYSEYIDEESIAKMYLLQEYSLNLDTGITSFYLYKDSDMTGDGKFHMAPVWDFDMSIGNYGIRDNVNLSDPEVWWANRAQIYNVGGLNILAQAVQYESVKKRIVEQWNDIFYPVIRECLEEDGGTPDPKRHTISSYEKELAASAGMNFLVWPDALRHTVTGIWNGNDFAQSVGYVRDFLKRREAFLHRAFAYGAASGYDALTGSVVIDGVIRAGEEITAQVKGSNAGSFVYQWMADAEPIAGATDAVYRLSEADVGMEISVRIKDADGKLLSAIYGTAPQKVQGAEKPDPDPVPEPDPTPDPAPAPLPEEHPVPAVLAASDVTGVTSTKAGVKIRFGGVEHASCYEVYRKAGGRLLKLGAVKKLSFTDSDPAGGKEAAYMVKAVSGDQTKYTDAGFGAAKSIRLPKAPGGLKAGAKKGGKVTLSWKKVKGASAYLIFRAESRNGTYRLVKTVKKQKTDTYTDRPGGKKKRTYYYKAAVLKNGKYSPLSGAVKGTVKK